MQNGVLPEEEARHCIRVLRKKVGDEIMAVDGRGNRYTCRLISDNVNKAEVEVTDSRQIESHWHPSIELAVAPTKNHDRMEWLLEKVTEMGIDRFTPLKCDHSERKNVNLSRLNKIAVSAMKQSLKAALPVIDDITPIKDYVTEPFAGEKFICYCDENTPRVSILNEEFSHKPVRILIGPEGDFSPEEVRLAIENGYKPVNLGESRLRTETAALVAVADAHAIRRMRTDKMK